MVNCGHYFLPCKKRVADIGLYQVHDHEVVIDREEYIKHAKRCVPCAETLGRITARQNNRIGSSLNIGHQVRVSDVQRNFIAQEDGCGT